MSQSDYKRTRLNIEIAPPGTLVIVIHSRLTRYEVPEIHRRLKKELRLRQVREIKIDLSHVSAVDTAGVALLVAICREARKKGMGFTLENPSEHTIRVIKLARLENLLLENREKAS